MGNLFVCSFVRHALLKMVEHSFLTQVFFSWLTRCASMSTIPVASEEFAVDDSVVRLADEFIPERLPSSSLDAALSTSHESLQIPATSQVRSPLI